jgi:hypothetical protein
VEVVVDWEAALLPACAAALLLLLVLLLLVLVLSGWSVVLVELELAVRVDVHEVGGFHQQRAWVLCS